MKDFRIHYLKQKKPGFVQETDFVEANKETINAGVDVAKRMGERILFVEETQYTVTLDRFLGILQWKNYYHIGPLGTTYRKKKGAFGYEVCYTPDAEAWITVYKQEIKKDLQAYLKSLSQEERESFANIISREYNRLHDEHTKQQEPERDFSDIEVYTLLNSLEFIASKIELTGGERDLAFKLYQKLPGRYQKDADEMQALGPMFVDAKLPF